MFIGFSVTANRVQHIEARLLMSQEQSLLL